VFENLDWLNIMKFKMTKQITNYGENTTQAINIINEGTVIRGDIVANGDIRIDGELVGNIGAKGRLVIGPNGKVEGQIDCNNIEVAGYIKGKVIVSEMLTMKASAKIFGELVAGKLSVEPGSLFTGTCTMGDVKNASAVNERPVPKEQKQI
jgi:cytoskeletal protein CcmA (bactofilin family)